MVVTIQAIGLEKRYSSLNYKIKTYFYFVVSSVCITFANSRHVWKKRMSDDRNSTSTCSLKYKQNSNMKRLIILLVAMVVTAGAFAQKEKAKKYETYNYLRGMESVEEEDYSTALSFFQKDVEQNPKSGHAHLMIAISQAALGESGEAMGAVEKAIALLPKKDEHLADAYELKAHVHLEMEDTISALDDLAQAIKCNPKDVELYQNRGQIYYEQKKYDLSNAEYQKCIDMEPGDVVGYMGLGRNANMQEKWEEAIPYFDKVEKLSNDYNKQFVFRAQSYIGLKKFNEAVDDLIKFEQQEQDYSIVPLLRDLPSEGWAVARTKLKLKMLQNPTEACWPFFLAVIEEKMENYKTAIDYYSKSDELDGTNGSLTNIVDCCKEMGDYKRAMNLVEKALEEDSTNYSLIVSKLIILEELGRYEEAAQEAEKIFDDGDSYNATNFFIRGSARYRADKLEDALDDLTMAITDMDGVPEMYYVRARIHEAMGNDDLAKVDYTKVLELLEDTTVVEIAYAQLKLGEKDKAVEMMEAVLKADESKGNLYDACCIHSLLGEKEKALEYLEKALEKGWRSFEHMEHDTDLDNIRDMQQYKDLVEKYKALLEKELSDNANQGANTDNNTEKTVAEVPFTKEGGVCKVKCQVNGLPLHFVFDTGASDVSISLVEANFMFKNGYLSANDVVGRQHYLDANGNVTEGTIVNIKKVNFGGLDLTNVRASVVGNQKAPLLLGQSVLGKLGKIEIDNAKKVLRITH